MCSACLVCLVSWSTEAACEASGRLQCRQGSLTGSHRDDGMKLSTVARILSSWKVVVPLAATAIIAAGVHSYLADLATVKLQIEEAFLSRARLTERFMAMNIGQVAVMRNRLQADYQENRAGRDFTVIKQPELGVWSVASALGKFSGDIAQPVDAEIR